jgi:hypothetical protein
MRTVIGAFDGFHAYINKMHGSSGKINNVRSVPCEEALL